MTNFKVYISSTFEDFKEERDTLMKWLSDNQWIPTHSYVAGHNPLVAHCTSDVRSCDVFILMLGMRYGSQPEYENPDNLSITQLEFRAARDHGIDCLVFEKTLIDVELMDRENEDKLDAFKSEVKKTTTPAKFKDSSNIITVVSTALEVLKRKKIRINDSMLPAGLRDPSVLAEDQGLRGRLREERQSYISFRNADYETSGISPDMDYLVNNLKNSAKPLIITGEGGLGKTRLAIELVNRMRGEYLPALVEKNTTEGNLNSIHGRAVREQKRLLLVLDYIEDMGASLTFDRLVDWVSQVQEGEVRLVVTTRRTERSSYADTGPKTLTPHYCEFLDLGSSSLKKWRHYVAQTILNDIHIRQLQHVVIDRLEEIDNPAIATLLTYDAEQHGTLGYYQTELDTGWLLRRLRRRVQTNMEPESAGSSTQATPTALITQFLKRLASSDGFGPSFSR